VRLVEAGLATPSDMYFTATVQRSSVTVSAHVSVGHDYPASTPLMVVSLQWAGILRTALNDEAIRVGSHHTDTFSRIDIGGVLGVAGQNSILPKAASRQNGPGKIDTVSSWFINDTSSFRALTLGWASGRASGP